MPTLTLKGLPDPIYERLKAQAAANRRSLNGEIIMCLERAVRAARDSCGRQPNRLSAARWIAPVSRTAGVGTRCHLGRAVALAQ